MNAYQLANLADVQSPDSLESPGAQWLVQVASYADEIDASEEYWQDEVSEAADSVVPIYTHNRWQVFVDLCAYTEDVNDIDPGASADMNDRAGLALYMIAERLLVALVEAKAEEAEDDWTREYGAERDHESYTVDEHYTVEYIEDGE